MAGFAVGHHAAVAVGHAHPAPERTHVTASVVRAYLAAKPKIDPDIVGFLTELVKNAGDTDKVDLRPLLALDKGADQSRTRHVMAILLVAWHREKMAAKKAGIAAGTTSADDKTTDDDDEPPAAPGQLRYSLFNNLGVGNVSGADNLAFNLPGYTPYARGIDANPIVSFMSSDAGTAPKHTLYTAASPTWLAPAFFLTDKLSLQAYGDWTTPGAPQIGVRLGGHNDISADAMPGFLKNKAQAYFYYGGGVLTYSPLASGLSQKAQAVAIGAQGFARIESLNQNLLGTHLQFRLGADLDTSLNLTSDHTSFADNSKLRPGSDALLVGQEKLGDVQLQWATGARVQADLLGQQNLTLGIPAALSITYGGSKVSGHLEIGGTKFLNASGSDPSETHYGLLAIQPSDGKFSVGVLVQGASAPAFQAINSLGIAATYAASKKVTLGLGAAIAAPTGGSLQFSDPQFGATLSWSP